MAEIKKDRMTKTKRKGERTTEINTNTQQQHIKEGKKINERNKDITKRRNNKRTKHRHKKHNT